jgi:homogentisate 1,2-dioxygenase
MGQYRCAGEVPHKRHTQLRDPNGQLLHEEMITAKGFSDFYSLLYHVSPPTEVRAIEAEAPLNIEEWDCGMHRHHLFDTQTLPSVGSYFDSRRALLFNDELVVSIAAPNQRDKTMYRNALADELVVVAEGAGTLNSQFGRLAYEAGDLVVIPRGTTQDWELAPVAHRLLIIESTTPIVPPPSYQVGRGQFSEHSPYCERDLKAPELVTPRVERGDFAIRVKVGHQINRYHLAWHPYDVAGWDGCFYPYSLNMRDFEPITRRIHTMPDEHTVFLTNSAAICCIVPRILEYHPLAIPAAPHHSSIDIDEVMFYMGHGNKGWTRATAGVTTFHPRGIPHGPKPGLYEGSIGMKEFDGKSIMMDSLKPLRIARAGKDCDDPSYPYIWLGEKPSAER